MSVNTHTPVVVGRLKVVPFSMLCVTSDVDILVATRMSLFVAERSVCLKIDGSVKILIPFKNLFPVQIENALTAHLSIREAAAVSVPDAQFGEVVGAWIVLEPGTTMTREDVRKVVSDAINPQVCPSSLSFFLSEYIGLVERPCVGVVRW